MASAFHVYFGPDFAPDAATQRPKVRRIGPRDCFAALAEGIDDVLEMPTYPAFVGLFYGLAGVALVSLTSFGNALHLAFPLAAGFTLVGPFVAVGLYEMSRRREQGLAATWRDAFAVLRSPALPSILALGFLLFVDFLRLDRGGATSLRPDLRPRSAGRRHPLLSRRPDDRARLAAHCLSADRSAFALPRWRSASASSPFRCCSIATSGLFRPSSLRCASRATIRARSRHGASLSPRR